MASNSVQYLRTKSFSIFLPSIGYFWSKKKTEQSYGGTYFSTGTVIQNLEFPLEIVRENQDLFEVQIWTGSRFGFLAGYPTNVQFYNLKGVPSKQNPTKIITRATKDCKFLIQIQGRFSLPKVCNFNLSIFFSFWEY